MTLFIIMLPLMIAAVAIATLPLLYSSVREHRLVNTARVEKPKPYPDLPARPSPPGLDSHQLASHGHALRSSSPDHHGSEGVAVHFAGPTVDQRTMTDRRVRSGW